MNRKMEGGGAGRGGGNGASGGNTLDLQNDEPKEGVLIIKKENRMKWRKRGGARSGFFIT